MPQIRVSSLPIVPGLAKRLPDLRKQSEPFLTWLCLADLQYVDGLGELAGAPGQQRSLRRMRQVLSWAFARLPGERNLACAWLAWFCDAGLFFPLYGIFA
jgi:hypothetical protein